MNPYTNLTTAQFDPLSLQEIMMVPLARQQQHNQNEAQIEQMGIYDVNRLETDNNYISDGISSLKNKQSLLEDELYNNGTGRNLTKKMMSLKRERDMFLSNDGDGGKAQNAYNSYIANVKNIQSNKNMSEAHKRAGIQKALMDYKSSGGVENGASYQDYMGVDNVEIQDKAIELASEMSPQKIENITGWKITNRNGKNIWVNGSQTTEKLPMSLIQDAVLQTMMNDESVVSYLQESTNLGLIDDPMQYLKNSVVNASNLKQIYNEINEESMKTISTDGAGNGNNDGGSSIYSLIGKEHYYKERYPDGIEQVREVSKEKGERGELARRDLAEIEYLIQNDSDYKNEKKSRNSIISNYYKNNKSIIDKSFKIEDAELSSEQISNIKKDLIKFDGESFSKSLSGNVRVEGDKVYYYDGDNSRSKRQFKSGYSVAELKEGYGLNIKQIGTIDRDQIRSKNSLINQLKESDKRIEVMKETAFNKATKGQYMKYGFENMKQSEINQFENSIFKNLKAGGMDNYEILSAKGFEADGSENNDSEDLLDVDKSHTTAENLFNRLKSADDFEVLSIQNNPISNTPSVTVLFSSGKGEDKINQELEIGLDVNRNYDGIKSGESQIIRFLRNNFDESGQKLADDFEKGINYKNIHVTSNRNDYSQSNSIKKSLVSTSLNDKLSNDYGNEYSINVFRNQKGNFKISMGDSGNGSPNNTFWNEFVSIEDVKMDGKNDDKNVHIRNMLIEQLIKNGKLNLDNVESYDQIDNLIEKELSEEIQSSDKFKIFDLINLM